MYSKWFDKKQSALMLRKRGASIRAVEKKLGIPRSTLSGWFKHIHLSDALERKLLEKWRLALIRARKKAAERHNTEKEKRIHKAAKEAQAVVKAININHLAVLELALAMLYLGEGTKNSYNIRMANSNPDILKTFIKLLYLTYGIDTRDIRCGLNLRADQNPFKIKRFWSRHLEIPLENFTYIFVDKRTVVSKTYPTYMGVCIVRCGNIALKRRIEAISNQFCRKILGSEHLDSL